MCGRPENSRGRRAALPTCPRRRRARAAAPTTPRSTPIEEIPIEPVRTPSTSRASSNEEQPSWRNHSRRTHSSAKFARRSVAKIAFKVAVLTTRRIRGRPFTDLGAFSAGWVETVVARRHPRRRVSIASLGAPVRGIAALMHPRLRTPRRSSRARSGERGLPTLVCAPTGARLGALPSRYIALRGRASIRCSNQPM